jgi:hypothetical protein
MEAPGVAVLLPCLLETLKAFGVIVHRSDICLQDDVLCRCGADDLREPAQVGRVPSGPAHGTDSLPEQQGVETERGILCH